MNASDFKEGQTIKITATESDMYRKLIGDRQLTATVVEVYRNSIEVEVSDADAAALGLRGGNVFTITISSSGPTTFVPQWTIETEAPSRTRKEIYEFNGEEYSTKEEAQEAVKRAFPGLALKWGLPELEAQHVDAVAQITNYIQTCVNGKWGKRVYVTSYVYFPDYRAASLLTVSEVARFAGVGRQYINDEIRAERLPATKYGKQNMIKREDYFQWVHNPRRGSRSKVETDK